MRTLLRAIEYHANLDLQIIATGIHLLPRFGNTIRHIRDDGFTITAKVCLQDGSDDAVQEAIGVGRAVTKLAEKMQDLDPDVVVVLGDRVEAMAGALAAVVSRRILAHIHGGDVATGDIDDVLRHAITKLAHLHFPATKASARRILRLGEAHDRIHVVGSLALDELRALPDPSPDWLARRLDLPRTRGNNDPVPYALVVQHPIGDTPRREQQRMEHTLRAVAGAGLWSVVIYPNSDPGHSGILSAISARSAARSGQTAIRGGLTVFRSLPREDYLRLLIGARVLVGNSSSGIIESATAGTPAVNIGPRQAGRQRCGSAVVDCDYARAAITRALRQAMAKRPRRGRRSVYGDGTAGDRIAALLATAPLDSMSHRKRIRY